MILNLILIQHGESKWYQKNLFTGWTDVDLTQTGVDVAKNARLQEVANQEKTVALKAH